MNKFKCYKLETECESYWYKTANSDIKNNWSQCDETIENNDISPANWHQYGQVSFLEGNDNTSIMSASICIEYAITWCLAYSLVSLTNHSSVMCL